MDEYSELDEDLDANPGPPVGDGVPWGGIVGTLGLVLLVVFAVQNTETVSIEFLWLSGDFPLAIVILVTAVSAVLVALVSGAFFRRKRRARRAEKHELRQRRSDD